MKNMKLYAYYFPNWHVDARNDKWHGKGWTEWEVTKCARPRFEDHYQPRVPLWGYEDEADPKVMAKKIAYAKSYGIQGFIFDTYYYDDGPYRERCLDEGFLKAEGNEDFEFSVMWCNHDAIYSHPSPRLIVAPVLKSGAVNEEAFIRITNDFINKYFVKPNYMRIDGKIMFTIYNMEKLIRELGGVDELKRILADFRQRVRDKGLGEMHLCTVPAIMEDAIPDKRKINDLLVELGVDEGVRYWWDCKDPTGNDTRISYEYEEFIEKGAENIEDDLKYYNFPVSLHVMGGIDQSPRTIQSEIYENINLYPWYAICHGCTPELYGKAFRMVKGYADRGQNKGHFMTVIWNEWTEGNYLEPDERYGYGMLEEIKKALEE
ncbi:MAG: glycoside hydrolase family 99-like domain-containing protein [Clostridia bacterium]|nr:glycoside hydrolase family 99-like domain-containing protein [Clostridia bacterium]